MEENNGSYDKSKREITNSGKRDEGRNYTERNDREKECNEDAKGNMVFKMNSM